MKYRHSFHAGNFADVHKHVTLVALLEALARKGKGFLFLDTHAGRGAYDLGSAAARQGGESEGGIERLLETLPSEAAGRPTDPLGRYVSIVRAFRRESGQRHAYPGSPLIAAALLRPQDRAVLIETQAEEHAELRRALRMSPTAAALRMTDENGDGYLRLAAWLPPLERRALVLIDPPYEESRADAQCAADAAATAIARLAGAVVAVWYPIKLAADAQRWRTALVQRLAKPALVSELWLHPCDSRAGLNGSGLLIVNPPYLVAAAMRGWLALLQRLLAPSGRSHHSGHAVLEV